jgi:acyl-CoA synthetase (AMP-forming)/AMP-acid ligase II
MVDHWFIRLLKDGGSKTFLIRDDCRYSYSQLYENIIRLYGQIREKINKNAAVAIDGEYTFDAISMLFALYYNQNIVVPVIEDLTGNLNEKLVVSKVKYRITLEGNEPKIIEIEQDKNEPLYENLSLKNHPGLVLFSSGITGAPKAMVHDLTNLLDAYKNRPAKDINSIIFMNLDHIGGIDTLFRLLTIHGTITVPNQRDPFSICKLIEKYNVGVLPCTPTFLNLILMSGAYQHADLSSLEIVGYGAEKMSDTLLMRLKEIFPNVRFQQKFGTSETNAIKIVGHPEDNLYFKIVDPNVEFKIVDGELWLNSKNHILGYLNSDMDNFEGDWFRTGDLVSVKDKEYIRIIGRIKEQINVGGEKVNPNEIEEIILNLDFIEDCMVYGVKNLITGESVSVDIVIKEGYLTNDTKEKVRLFCSKNLPPYKRPAKISLVNRIEYTERFKKKRKID